MSPRAIFIWICQILLTIAVLVLCYLLVIWVLGMLGISIPEHILRVVFVILALIGIIAILTNRFPWFGPPKA